MRIGAYKRMFIEMKENKNMLKKINLSNYILYQEINNKKKLFFGNNLLFHIQLENYPLEEPKIRILSLIFHPSFDSGRVYYQTKWK